MNKYFFAFLLSTLSLSAMATDEGVFKVRVTSQGNGDALLEAQGWLCTSSTDVGYQEELSDHKGKRKMYNRSVKGSLFSTEFRKDMRVTSAVTTRVSESCSRIVDGKELKDGVEVDAKITEQMTFNWDCTFNKFPQKEGQTLSTTCDAAKSGTGAFTLDQQIMAMMREKKIVADITMKKRYESYAVDLCKGKDLKTRKIIKLTQGLDSLMLEDDFVISLEIDGISAPIKLRNNNGVLNDEIAICRNGPITIKVTAVEEDPIYDDIYSCVKGSNTVILNAGSWDENSATIDFKRDNMWDKIFLDDAQQIRLEIRESPVK